MTEPKPCPICNKPSTPEHRPFCSDRCRKVDLHRWLSESYRIPVDDETAQHADNDDSDE